MTVIYTQGGSCKPSTRPMPPWVGKTFRGLAIGLGSIIVYTFVKSTLESSHEERQLDDTERYERRQALKKATKDLVTQTDRIDMLVRLLPADDKTRFDNNEKAMINQRLAESHNGTTAYSRRGKCIM